MLTEIKGKGPKEVEQAITTFGNAEAKKLGYIPRKRPIGITWAAMRIAAGDKPMIVPFKGRDLWLYVTRVGIDTYHMWIVEPWGNKQIGPHAQNGRITSEIVLRIRQSKSENVHPHNTGPPY